MASLSTLPSFPLTSIYHIPPLKESKENNVLIFIPGNPGLVEYYITYLNLIHQQYPMFEIYCISHAGYQTTDDYLEEGSKKYPIFDLQFQVQHKCSIINNIVEQKSGDVNLYIMAHSVGSYITQRVVKNLSDSPKINLKFIGFICPTVINIKESSSGQRLVWLLKWIPVVQLAIVFSWILSFLPVNFIKWIFRRCIFSSPVVESKDTKEALENSVDASYKLVRSSRIVKQALTMAIEEMDMILDDSELNHWFFKELSKQGTKIWTYFAFEDYWIHGNTRAYILTQFHDDSNPNLSFQIGMVDDGITHSFCVDQSVEFSQITLEMFTKFLNM